MNVNIWLILGTIMLIGIIWLGLLLGYYEKKLEIFENLVKENRISEIKNEEGY